MRPMPRIVSAVDLKRERSDVVEQTVGKALESRNLDRALEVLPGTRKFQRIDECRRLDHHCPENQRYSGIAWKVQRSALRGPRAVRADASRA
jgi:hypothetical protein